MNNNKCQYCICNNCKSPSDNQIINGTQMTVHTKTHNKVQKKDEMDFVINSHKTIKTFPKRNQNKRFDQDHFNKGKNN